MSVFAGNSTASVELLPPNSGKPRSDSTEPSENWVRTSPEPVGTTESAISITMNADTVFLSIVMVPQAHHSFRDI
jgi:hypothetical protein